jgi:hypothetical protein
MLTRHLCYGWYCEAAGVIHGQGKEQEAGYQQEPQRQLYQAKQDEQKVPTADITTDVAS